MGRNGGTTELRRDHTALLKAVGRSGRPTVELCFQTTIPDTEFNSLIINDKDLKELERQVHILMEVLK